MKTKINLLIIIFLTSMIHCNLLLGQEKTRNDSVRIIFLHHSTGKGVWKGSVTDENSKHGELKKLFLDYNTEKGTNYRIIEQSFPKSKPYGWKNYPYDYYNIWVKNGTDSFYMKEPTLKYLGSKYDIIIFKHCFPVSNILADDGNPSADSSKKTLANYKLQYNALKNELLKYKDTKFVVWTGAALTKAKTTPENAQRAESFFKWVKFEWDDEGDNIFIWDFWDLQTEGGFI